MNKKWYIGHGNDTNREIWIDAENVVYMVHGEWSGCNGVHTHVYLNYDETRKAPIEVKEHPSVLVNSEAAYQEQLVMHE